MSSVGTHVPGRGTVYRVFCDESGQTKSRYMVFGGVIVNSNDLDAIADMIGQWRAYYGMRAEVKWTRVSNQKFTEYRALVDVFFTLAEMNLIHFKSVIFDTTQFDFRFHRNDPELGFYKFYYQFLLHKFGRYARDESFRMLVFLDQRTTSRYELTELRDVLNAGVRKKYRLQLDVIRQVEPVDSKKSDIMQLADVLMGAVGSHANDQHKRPDCREAKRELAGYIAKRVGVYDLRQRTPIRKIDFEIWPFRFGTRN